ncbi:MAG: protein phosphatase 2C domain-containing protein [Oscillospiraceae bacterium]|nr:protein phosphatase 2C domain-containing protein [Oscillospiraceae bacterium]
MNNTKNTAAPRDMISLTDFLAGFCVGQKRDNGEDSEKYSLHCEAATVAVFDGCGGAGAKSYPRFYNKTGAYIAAHRAADAYQEWFEEPAEGEAGDPEALKRRIVAALEEVDACVGEKSRLSGMISRRFPTTLAAAVCRPGEQGMNVDLYWAGDSRVYLLDAQGLAQLTEDDLGGIDPFENLTEDGVLTNVISLSGGFTIHSARVVMKRPGIVFAATDGCFGYLSTPMEFEHLLLQTLLSAKSVNEWESSLREAIGEVAGDDYTLRAISLGFGDFRTLQRALAPRADSLDKQIIRLLPDKSREEKRLLWQGYRENYCRLLCRVG